MGRQPRDVSPVEEDSTAVGTKRASDEVQDARLAGPVRPDDTHRLAGRDGKGQIIRHDDAAEGPAKAIELKQRRPAIAPLHAV
jgi:hypothetical protein